MKNHPENTMPPLVSIVIPVYCEAEILPTTLQRIKAELDVLKITYEIIVIDDGSTDATWQKLQTLQKDIAQLTAKRFSRNFGKEAGILAGLRSAKGQAVVVMDADLQHPPELLPEMIHIWQSANADVIETVKTKPQNESFIRRIGSRFFYTLMYLLTDYDLSRQSDYKLMDRKVVNALLELGEFNRFYRGLVAWLGFRHVEITFTVPERTVGQSSWKIGRLILYALQSITSFSSKPLQIITVLGVGFFILAGLLVLRVFYQLFAGTAVSGFATVILLQLIIGSILMMGIGLIGIYLANIYEEVKRRPNYIIAEDLSAESETKKV